MSRKKIVIIVITIVIILIILVAFFSPGMLGIAIPDKGDLDPEVTFADRMTKYVENIESINDEIKDPIIPMFFHYLNRYFDGYNEDQIDEAFQTYLDFLDPQYSESLKQTLETYNKNKEILEPIIPQEYYNLQVSQKIDLMGTSGFLNQTLAFGQAMDASLKGGKYAHEIPGKIRWILSDQIGYYKSSQTTTQTDSVWADFGNVAVAPMRPVNITEPYIHHITYSDNQIQKTEETIHIYADNLEITEEQKERAPRIKPGTEVILTGANFYNKDLTIQILSNLDDSAQLKRINIPGWVMGDLDTPVLNNEWNWDDVQDQVWFKMPHLEPGYYAIAIYEEPVDDPAFGPLDLQLGITRHPIIFYVPYPQNQNYVIQLYEIYCEDETNPETFLGANLQDDIFAYFAVTTGTQQPWPIEVFYEENYANINIMGIKYRFQKPLQFDDKHTEYINEYKDGWLFGRDRKLGKVDGTVAIMLHMVESDTGEGDYAKEMVDVLIDIGGQIAGAFGVPGLVIWFVSIFLVNFIGALIDWILADVIVGQDIIVFTEDELFWLTAEENRMAMEDSPHYISQRIRTPDGIEVWNGEYGFEEYAFWEWRCYKNNDEPSEYWIKIRVQRIP